MQIKINERSCPVSVSSCHATKRCSNLSIPLEGSTSSCNLLPLTSILKHSDTTLWAYISSLSLSLHIFPIITFKQLESYYPQGRNTFRKSSLSSRRKMLLSKAQIIDHIMKTLKGAIQMDYRLLSSIQLLDYTFITPFCKPVTEPKVTSVLLLLSLCSKGW